MREEEIKQLEIDKIHWRDLYWEECEKNKKLKECNKSQSEVINNVFIPQRERLEEENKKLKDIINNIIYLYKEEPTELGEYVKSGFKGGMSN